MRHLQGVTLLGLILSASALAWAQTGMYGSPSMVRLPATQPQGYYPAYSTVTQDIPPQSAVPYPAAGNTGQLPPAGPQFGVPASSYGQGAQPYGFPGQPYAVPAGAAYGNRYTPSQPPQPPVVPPALPPAATTAPALQPPAAPPAPPIVPPAPPLVPSEPLPTPAPQPQPAPQPVFAPPSPAQPQPLPQLPAVQEPRGIGPLLEESEYSGSAGPCLSGSNGCNGGAACGDASCAPSCDWSCYSPTWYVSANALIMGRNKANHFWTSYDSRDEAAQLMHTGDCETDWVGGWEITGGRWFCCGEWALEVTYWGLDTMEGASSITVPGASVSSTFDVRWLDFNGTAAQLLFDNAEEHRLRRQDEFHNLELAVVGGQACCDPNGFQVDWSIGPRWFRFGEDLSFATLANGGTWGGSGADEAYFRDHVTNDLVGLQVGIDLNYQMGNKWRWFFSPKLGIYNNHIENEFDFFRGDGVRATPQLFPGESYPVQSSTNTVAFLGQFDLGVDWQFHRNWNAFLGYRVMFATGIGLADHQLPFYMVDIPEIGDIKTNGDLLLHGAFAGLSFNY